jgi:hypothetical protein
MDGNWHCLEFEMGLATSVLRFWLDGTLYAETTTMDWDVNEGATFDYMQHFSVGNISSTFVWQSSWQAIEVDDLVIADSYVGPISEGSSSKRTLFRK